MRSAYLGDNLKKEITLDRKFTWGCRKFEIDMKFYFILQA